MLFSINIILFAISPSSINFQHSVIQTDNYIEICGRDKWGELGKHDLALKIVTPDNKTKKIHRAVTFNNFSCINHLITEIGIYNISFYVNKTLLYIEDFEVKKIFFKDKRLLQYEAAQKLLGNKNIILKINSLGIEIYCTKDMKLCKTDKEVNKYYYDNLEKVK